MFELLGLFVVVVAATAIGTTLVWINCDRRRRWRDGLPLDPPWTGHCSAYDVMDIRIPFGACEGLGIEVLRRCGRAAEERRPAVPWVLGYGGISWRTWSQEHALCAQPINAESTRIWCCSRPRYTSTVFDFGASRRVVTRLMRTLGEAAAEATTPAD